MDIKSIVNEIVESAVVSSNTIGALIKNVQTIATEMTKVLQFLSKVNDRLNKHEEAILQICESQLSKQNSEKENVNFFDPPKPNKTSQKPN